MTTGLRYRKKEADEHNKELKEKPNTPNKANTGSTKLLLPTATQLYALCYKPGGRGFETQWGEFLNLPNISGRSRPWGLLSL
jgi:hypothetical protein